MKLELDKIQSGFNRKDVEHVTFLPTQVNSSTFAAGGRSDKNKNIAADTPQRS